MSYPAGYVQTTYKNSQGQIGVLYAPYQGIDMYQIQDHSVLRMDGVAVEAVDNNIPSLFAQSALSYYYDRFDDLAIHWLDPGTAFRVQSDDGIENIITLGDQIQVAR